MIRKVGDPIEEQKYRYLTYPMCKCDSDGFVDVNEYLPSEFDLCILRIEGLDKTITGWIQTNVWDGLRFKDGYKVTHWKRTLDNY